MCIASRFPIKTDSPYPLLTAENHPEAAQITGEWLLQAIDAPSVFAWVPRAYAVVLGASQVPEQEVYLEALRDRAWPLCKRRGGGGAVLLGPHCLCVGVRLRRMPAWSPLAYFHAINGELAKSLNAQLPDATSLIQENGISDLAMGSRKIAGTSLYLSRENALYLASVLIEIDREHMDAVLRYPTREPEYRSGRSHADFLMGLKEAGLALDQDTLKQKISETLRLALADYF